MTVGEVIELLKGIFEFLAQIFGDLFSGEEGEEGTTEAPEVSETV